jgi:triacylglycerol lipase
MGRADAGRLAYQIGLPEIRFYDRDGAQAYILGNDTDAIVVCRGTEPDQWNDVRADLDAVTATAETVGRVHRGFKREVDDLWPRLELALVNNTRTLWFTGHSLGGAMTTICAGRCKLSHIRSNPRAVFTYGAPRVGNRRYVNFVRLEFYRWVNNNDIVPRVPPTAMGFRHTGTEVYLNSNGKPVRAHGWVRFVDRMRGFLQGLRQRRLDPLSDHSMNEYIKHIVRAIEDYESGRTQVKIPGVSFEPRPVEANRGTPANGLTQQRAAA